MGRGYVQIYTGNGKGKTTAALGLGMRAAGWGLQVLMIQFLKGSFSGELRSVKYIDNFKIMRLSSEDKMFMSLNETEKAVMKSNIQAGYNKILTIMTEESCDILILDEIMAAMHAKLLTEQQVCDLLHHKPAAMEVILTGRNVPPRIAARADLITEMKEVKHYYASGVPARDGIER